MWVWLLLGLCVFGASAEEEVATRNPFTTPADVARGRQLFGAQCALCHGPAGEGGRGANLARPKLAHAADDPALFRVLRDGISGTEMPGAYAMSEHEMWQVAAFIRTLGRREPETVLGDPALGKQIVAGRGGCLGCHSIEGSGGIVGPMLTEVGSRRSAAFLRATLLDPQSTIPDDFAFVESATRDGRKLSGIRINEDTYTIQIRDLAGNLHSLWKRDLHELRKDSKKTPMPAYRDSLNASELNAVVAYLVSLRGGL